MKFGGEAGIYGVDRFFTGGAAGAFTFSNFTTSQPNAGAAFSTQGSAFASFLLGEVYQANALIPVETSLRFNRYALFAQDEWRVSPRLTLSYGLRWDYQPPMTRGRTISSSTFVPALANPAAAGLPARWRSRADANGYGDNFQDELALGLPVRAWASAIPGQLRRRRCAPRWGSTTTAPRTRPR